MFLSHNLAVCHLEISLYVVWHSSQKSKRPASPPHGERTDWQSAVDTMLSAQHCISGWSSNSIFPSLDCSTCKHMLVDHLWLASHAFDVVWLEYVNQSWYRITQCLLWQSCYQVASSVNVWMPDNSVNYQAEYKGHTWVNFIYTVLHTLYECLWPSTLHSCMVTSGNECMKCSVIHCEILWNACTEPV